MPGRLKRAGRACLRLGVALAPLGAAAPAGAASYRCANTDFEIRCGAGRCERSDAHTPMSVSLDTGRRWLEVCAYSGCWSGRAALLAGDGAFVVARGDRLRRNGPQGGRAGAVLVISRAGMSGSVSAFGFQNPVTCAVR